MPVGRRTIRAVVFDLDDTLYFEPDYVRSGFSAVGAHLRQRLRRREAFETWMWRRFRAGKRAGMFDALNEHFSLGLDKREILALVRRYRDHRPALAPARGVVALLSELRRRGIKLGLLSDGYQPGQRRKLAALGLRRYFDAIVFTEDIGRSAWKPSPRGFVRIRGKLGVPHECCGYVGDNPGKDFLPPNRLGWLTVHWRKRRQVHADTPAPRGGKAKRTVRSARELLKVLFG